MWLEWCLHTCARNNSNQWGSSVNCSRWNKKTSNVQKLCVSHYLHESNKSQVDSVSNLDIVIAISNLTGYSNSYTKRCGKLSYYHKNIPSNPRTNSEVFTFKAKIEENTLADGNTNDFEIVDPLKYLSNIRRTLEMIFINCDIDLKLT